MPLANPNMQAIAQLLMKGQNPIGRAQRLEMQNPRGQLSGDVLLQLLEPGKQFLPMPPSQDDKEAGRLPAGPGIPYDYSFHAMSPNDAKYYMENPPYQIDDQGEVIYETQEDADADK